MALLWRLTPLGEWVDPQRVADGLSRFSGSPWAPLVVVAAYLVGNALLFPNIALNLGVILVFGPGWGVPAALAGTLLAGVAAFLLGSALGRDRINRLEHPGLRRGLSMVRDSGLPGMVLLRLLPIAPYPLVNLMLGAGGVTLRVFTWGTLFGVLPSLLAMGVFGLQLDRMLDHPGVGDWLLLAGIVAAYGVLVEAIRRRLQRSGRAEPSVS